MLLMYSDTVYCNLTA